MDVTLVATIGGKPDEPELRALREWLLEEDPRPGRVEFAYARPGQNEMGAVMDAVQVGMASGGALSVLAGSVASFIKTRRQPVTITVRRPDGTELAIRAPVSDAEAAAALESFLESSGMTE